MAKIGKYDSLILGLCILTGLSLFGYILGNAAIYVKQFERTVTVKGLSEREYAADTVIWPIQFTKASNNLEGIYSSIDSSNQRVRAFLKNNGIKDQEITVSTPSIIDKKARRYDDKANYDFRYTARQTVTVYSRNIGIVRKAMGQLSELGKQGIVLSGDDLTYHSQAEYLFTRLNQVKPEMIEEATKNAREVANKFAVDSGSPLGKIKSASQGQFIISERDWNNPHIKKVRVVSTITYYLLSNRVIDQFFR